MLSWGNDYWTDTLISVNSCAVLIQPPKPCNSPSSGMYSKQITYWDEPPSWKLIQANRQIFFLTCNWIISHLFNINLHICWYCLSRMGFPFQAKQTLSLVYGLVWNMMSPLEKMMEGTPTKESLYFITLIFSFIVLIKNC